MDSQKAQKLPHDIGGGESYEVDRTRGDRSRGRGLCLRRRRPAISREVSGYGLEIAPVRGEHFSRLSTSPSSPIDARTEMLSHFTLYFRRHLNF